MTTITIHLPDALAERVGGAARAVHRPVEEVLTAMLDGVVPSLDGVPEDMRTELVEMTWWDDARLMETADATMPEEDQARMVELSTTGPSSPAEQDELEALRTDYGRITLRKARATALLSIRGGKQVLAVAIADAPPEPGCDTDPVGAALS
ncbi:hypothetical protein CKO31_01095 [Thiohalocapsa halophila]|uniref:CopG family transcriptional regulator n=1 Tax=Thiohalocapsa halophila TaxID=69359 RepID=A0ABS1CBT6_9GAMM|nr:hypothetical protein [Thiohalocapsa halophila]MBK1629350.1 hypothetical protein [Thiohalocapsa halophila]